MPDTLDRNGQALLPGDTVLIRATVRHLDPGGEYVCVDLGGGAFLALVRADAVEKLTAIDKGGNLEGGHLVRDCHAG